MKKLRKKNSVAENTRVKKIRPQHIGSRHEEAPEPAEPARGSIARDPRYSDEGDSHT